MLQFRDLVLQCSGVCWNGGVGDSVQDRGGEQLSGAGHRDVGIIFGIVWKDLETGFRDRSSREKDLIRSAKLVRSRVLPVSEELRYDGERAVRMLC